MQLKMPQIFIISSYLLLYQNKFFMIDFKSIVLGKNVL